MRRLLALIGGSLVLLQATPALALVDIENRTTVLTGRENQELAALCYEKLGLAADDSLPSGVPLSHFRHFLRTEQARIDNARLVKQQQTRAAERLLQKQGQATVRFQSVRIMRSTQENLHRLRQLSRGTEALDAEKLIETLREQRTSRRTELQRKESERTGVVESLRATRRAIRITCEGVLPREREECIEKQVQDLN